MWLGVGLQFLIARSNACILPDLSVSDQPNIRRLPRRAHAGNTSREARDEPTTEILQPLNSHSQASQQTRHPELKLGRLGTRSLSGSGLCVFGLFGRSLVGFFRSAEQFEAEQWTTTTRQNEGATARQTAGKAIQDRARAQAPSLRVNALSLLDGFLRLVRSLLSAQSHTLNLGQDRVRPRCTNSRPSRAWEVQSRAARRLRRSMRSLLSLLPLLLS